MPSNSTTNVLVIPHIIKSYLLFHKYLIYFFDTIFQVVDITL